MEIYRYNHGLTMIHFLDGSILLRKEWPAEEDGLIPAPEVYAFNNDAKLYANKWATRILDHALV